MLVMQTQIQQHRTWHFWIHVCMTVSCIYCRQWQTILWDRASLITSHHSKNSFLKKQIEWATNYLSLKITTTVTYDYNCEKYNSSKTNIQITLRYTFFAWHTSSFCFNLLVAQFGFFLELFDITQCSKRMYFEGQ